jgi:phage tail sheath protein FI
MPQYMTPGVYVEEVQSMSKPIEGVATSVAAFVGLAPFGPINTPVRLTNWSDFARQFGNPANQKAGPFMRGSYLAHAVYGFFHNGGALCYVVRVGDGSAPGAQQRTLPAATQGEPLRAIVKEGYEDVTIKIEEEESQQPVVGNGNGAGPPPTYTVEINAKGLDEPERIKGVTIQPGNSYIVTKLNRESEIVAVEETTSTLTTQRPPLKPDTYEVKGNGTLKALEVSDLQGDETARTGLAGLGAIDEITMISVPDMMILSEDEQEAVQLQMIAHCESRSDRMAIIDAPRDLDVQGILQWRADRGYTSKFATVYYPWLEVMDPVENQPVLVPPSGHVAGVWARTDATRGVHKAPANEEIMGATGLSFPVTHADQGEMNRQGINCIRAFPGRGVRIWGARTMSTLEDPEWRYINVRRLFNYVSESIMEGTQWAVFEPNDATLWTQLRIAVTNFLTRVWRDGALFGTTPGEAFFVKCDEETNPPDMVEAGRVTVEIGIAPVKPAEFVVFRISQFQVGADTTA